MTNVFVYEFVTGGGLLDAADASTLDKLAAEGAAMSSALVADFAVVPGVRVSWLRDARLSLALPGEERVVASHDEHHAAFRALSAEADWTVVIAPELEGHLLERCQAVLDAGGRLLGPSPEFVALASDKHATAEALRAAGVPAPRGVRLAPRELLPRDFPYPAVWKPIDGAGSTGVRFVASGERGAGSEQCEASLAVLGRLEQFCPGLPASVAFLCGPGVVCPLVPCEQRLSTDGRFSYFGGSLPLAPELADRAVGLGRRALAALPVALGYVGIDLVLGDDPDGGDDYVIEVNPRLTTSYVGLRAASQSNLAAALLASAAGEAVKIEFAATPLEFAANGKTAPSRSGSA
ncbi:MAG: ATP-grasp domain-containing protein [Pirellulales bacterium]